MVAASRTIIIEGHPGGQEMLLSASIARHVFKRFDASKKSSGSALAKSLETTLSTDASPPSLAMACGSLIGSSIAAQVER